MSGKFDTPCFFVKTGTVQSAGFSQTKESLGTTPSEQPRYSEDSIATCAREVKIPDIDRWPMAGSSKEPSTRGPEQFLPSFRKEFPEVSLQSGVSGKEDPLRSAGRPSNPENSCGERMCQASIVAAESAFSRLGKRT
jgi:hypothetical protein